MNKKLLSLVVVFSGFVFHSSVVQAQTTRNVVVEHFTNTRCSICKGRNPGLFSNLSTSPEIHHISYHPSSPYSSCQLNQHNVSGNDDRAKFYGVYGATPRVVVQGTAKSNGVDFTSKDLFSGEQGQMTPVDIALTTIKKGSDSLVVRIRIKTTQSHSLENLMLNAVAAEDTVFYNAPNGEKQHFNVYRKTLINQAISLPKTVGDSLVYTVSTVNHVDWDASRMFVMAFIQTNDKKIEQVASSKGDEDVNGGGNSGLTELDSEQQWFYPNPASETLTFITPDNYGVATVVVSDLTGKTLYRVDINKTGQNYISVQETKEGTYLLQFLAPSGKIVSHKKLIILR